MVGEVPAADEAQPEGPEIAPAHQHLVWFVRRGAKMKGPFPAGVIANHILLGRIREGDELSSDRKEWLPLSEHQELIPDVMKADLSDPYNQERLAAAKRWADDRGSRDRRDGKGAGDHAHERRSGDRRHAEGSTTLGHRRARDQRQRDKASPYAKMVFFAVVAITVITVAVHLAFFDFNWPPEEVNCDAPAAPKVNWSNCPKQGSSLTGASLAGAKLTNIRLVSARLVRADLSGADLGYATATMSDLHGANLSGARLVGTELRGANLAGANLSGADLSFANLSRANIRSADLTDARLDNTIWPTGEVCVPGSVGQCRVAAAK